MDVVPILSTIILISTIITLIVAVASYMTFRVKEKRKQAAMAQFSDVFSEDMKALMENDDGVTVVEPVQVTSAPPVALEAPPPPVPAPEPITTVTAATQYPTQQGYPQPQPQFPQAMAQNQEQEPQPQYAPPPPAEPTYSGAQAAFMKGFGGQNPPPMPPQSGDPQAPTMRRFTLPEARPARKDNPESHGNETPVWK